MNDCLPFICFGRTTLDFDFLLIRVLNLCSGWHDQKQILALALVATLELGWEHHFCTVLFHWLQVAVVSGV